MTDQVDSVKVVVNDDGLPITRFEYLPYGETWFTEEKTGLEEEHNPKFNSQELDKETGYYFYNARHYDPEIARFVTADNVIDGEEWDNNGNLITSDPLGWNRYSYVKGNPVLYKDPTGHKVEIHGTKEEVSILTEAIETATGTKLTIKPVNKEKGVYNIAGFKSTDDRFNKEQGYLNDLIENKKTAKIKFDNNGEGGTEYKGRATYDDKTHTVYLGKNYKNNTKSDDPSYTGLTKRKKPTNLLDKISRYFSDKITGAGGMRRDWVKFERYDALSHELLGHAHDKISGKLEYNNSNEQRVRDESQVRAINRANSVRAKRGKAIRVNY